MEKGTMMSHSLPGYHPCDQSLIFVLPFEFFKTSLHYAILLLHYAIVRKITSFIILFVYLAG